MLASDEGFAALYFPWIQINDPIGTRKWVPPTGAILGVYARTERERGIWKAPAGNAAKINLGHLEGIFLINCCYFSGDGKAHGGSLFI